MNERAPGQTLERVIAAHGGFGIPVARARRILGHVARALATLNESGIIRGALPPANIILVIPDDGNEIASIVPHDESGPRPHVGYFAPERSGLIQTQLGWSTDVFPFAAILYEVLCGTQAFAREPTVELAHQKMLGPAPALGQTSATLPVELRDRPDLVISLDAHLARALHHDPSLRHPSVHQFWLDVDAILKEAVRPTASGEWLVDEPSYAGPGGPMPPKFGASNSDKHTSVGLLSDPMLDARVEWETLGPPIGLERLHASLLVEDGRAILAAGTRGLYRLVRGAWSRVPMPMGVDAKAVRGLSRLPSGELLLYGEPDFCCVLTARGAAQKITLPNRNFTINAAHADDFGVVFVGTDTSRSIGAAVILPRGAPATMVPVEATPGLTGVTRLSNGTILAVGMDGVIVELHEQGCRDVPWARSGHLYAVTSSLFGAAHAVGGGGHALRIEASPVGGPATVTLERVQTTRDLYQIAADARSGAMWAVGADARLLARRDEQWVRVPLDAAVTGRLLNVHLRSPRVIVIAEDGSAFAHDVAA